MVPDSEINARYCNEQALLAQGNFMSRKMFLKMLLNVFSFLCGVIDRKFD